MNPNILPRHDFDVEECRAVYNALDTFLRGTARLLRRAVERRRQLYRLRSLARSCGGCKRDLRAI